MGQPDSPPRRKPRFRERNAARRGTATPPAPPRREAPPPPPVSAKPPPAVRPVTSLFPRLTVEQGLFLLVIAIGFGLRIWDAGSRAMHGDEAEHAWFAWNLYR